MCSSTWLRVGSWLCVFTWWGSCGKEDGKCDLFVPLIHYRDVLWSVNTHYPHTYEVCLAVSSNGVKHRPSFSSTWTVCIFGRVRRIAKSDLSPSWTSVRMKYLGCHCPDVHEIWYMIIFRKSFQQIQVSLK